MQSDIVFPDEFETATQSFIPKIPPQCEDSSYCNITWNYPVNHIKAINNKVMKYRDLLGVDEIQPVIDTRIDLRENPMCMSVEEIVFPEVGKDENEQWAFIVQDKAGGAQQGVRVEVCKLVLKLSF